MSSSKQAPLLSRDGVSLLLPFIIITSCFALWGFANDITGPLVKAFSKIFRMSVTEGALVQVAFYLGYFCMAFPAALFIQRYSYKAGVLLGSLALCCRRRHVHPRPDGRVLLSLPRGIFHHDLRPVFP